MDYNSLFVPLAHALTSEYAAFIGGGIIVLLAVVAWISFYWQLHPITRDLSNALRTITRVPRDEAAFAGEFEGIKENLSRNKTLSHPWSEFNDVLILDTWSDTPRIYNGEAPADYFYRSSITPGRINLRFYNTVPNILTGLGILGTFIGLVAGIYLAGKGLGSGNAEKMQAALQKLLGGASLAFFTSIAGLLCSMLFNLYVKRRMHRLDAAIQRFVDALDARLERVTVESIATEQLEQSKQQTRTLEAFSSELAFQIADELGKKVNADLGPVLEKLVDSVEGLRNQRKDDASEMIERTVDQFQQSLTGAAGEQLSALGQTLETMNETLSSTIDGVKQAMQLAAETADRNREIVERNNEALEAMRSAGKEFSGLVEPLAQSASAIDSSATALGNTAESVSTIQSNIKESIERSEGIQLQLKDSWDQYESRFTSVDESLAAVFSELQSGLSEYTNTVREFVEGLDAHTASITQNLAGAVSEMNETLEELQEQLPDSRQSA